METEHITLVPMSTLHPHPRNNEFFDDADEVAFQALKDSIANVGLLTPLRVSADFTIISGHQRYRACKELGVEQVPVIVDEGLEDDNEKIMQLIVSNFGRMKNDPAKQGKLIEEYEKLMGVRQGSAFQKAEETKFRQLDQKEVATKFGITPQRLREYKRFSHMSPDIQEFVKTGVLSMTAAVRVLGSLSPDDQITLLSSFPDAVEHITQAELEERSKDLYAKAAEVEATRAETARKAEEARLENFEKQQLALEKAMTDAATQQREAERQADLAYARKEEVEKEIADLQEKIKAAEDQLDDVRSQIDEANEKAKPEITYPSDYEILKAKAQQVEFLNKQVEALRMQVQQQSQASQPTIPQQPKQGRTVMDMGADMSDESTDCLNSLHSPTNDLAVILKKAIMNPDILGGFNVDWKKAYTKYFIELIELMNKAIMQMEGK